MVSVSDRMVLMVVEALGNTQEVCNPVFPL